MERFCNKIVDDLDPLVDFLFEHADFFEVLANTVSALRRLDQARSAGMKKPFFKKGDKRYSSEFFGLFKALVGACESDDEWAYARGGILERLVQRLVVWRYLGAGECLYGARVTVNGKLVCAGKKNSIDMAAWRHDLSLGEFYECKTAAEPLEDSIPLLDVFRTVLPKHFSVAGITMASRYAIQSSGLEKKYPHMVFLCQTEILGLRDQPAAREVS